MSIACNKIDAPSNSPPRQQHKSSRTAPKPARTNTSPQYQSSTSIIKGVQSLRHLETYSHNLHQAYPLPSAKTPDTGTNSQRTHYPGEISAHALPQQAGTRSSRSPRSPRVGIAGGSSISGCRAHQWRGLACGLRLRGEGTVGGGVGEEMGGYGFVGAFLGRFVN
ncbi:hypothetical protein BDV29DRAFT_186122 [Aspergillus leporis]|uniref:Uncharacterized protein n=1 Tax=Aspergillus leporis TaxID=41062 RepID=A0A5N5WGI2_9EURO|nr:hypothetical protein BDV29DRAFT_186122 [Aspergillus leporis]